jgi:hypothetical protein
MLDNLLELLFMVVTLFTVTITLMFIFNVVIGG